MSIIFTIKGELGSSTKITIIITKKDLEAIVKNNSPQGRVEKFLHFTKRGPTFICVVWNRCIYASSVMEFQFNKYNFDLTAIIISVTHAIAILKNPTFQPNQSVISCRSLRPQQK